MSDAVLIEGLDSQTTQIIHSAAVTRLTPVLVHTTLVIPTQEADADAPANYVYRGKVQVDKEAALAVEFNQDCYWDDTAKVLTRTIAGNTKIGTFAQAALAADAQAIVDLQPIGEAGV